MSWLQIVALIVLSPIWLGILAGIFLAGFTICVGPWVALYDVITMYINDYKYRNIPKGPYRNPFRKD